MNTDVTLLLSCTRYIGVTSGDDQTEPKEVEQIQTFHNHSNKDLLHIVLFLLLFGTKHNYITAFDEIEESVYIEGRSLSMKQS